MIRRENRWLVYLTVTSLYNCIVVQLLSHVQLFETPWTAACQASNHLILCHPLLLPSSIFPSIRVFSNESVLHIHSPKNWSFSFIISPSNEYSRLISFRMDWLDLLAVQGTLKSLLQHISKASVFQHSLPYGSTLTSMIDYWKSFPLSWKLLVDKGCVSLLSHCGPSSTQSTVRSLIS